jgi:CheY-like chemotaxis protein
MNQRNILIADDDADLVDSLARRCRGLGLRALTASNALQALTKINHIRPDIVILDVDMPGGNGLSACEMMAGNYELASIPVIVLTGRSDSETQRRCHVSCAYYVSKCKDVWHRIEPLLYELLHLGAESEMIKDLGFRI